MGQRGYIDVDTFVTYVTAIVDAAMCGLVDYFLQKCKNIWQIKKAALHTIDRICPLIKE